MADELHIVVDEAGTGRCLYSDLLAPFMEGLNVNIVRASHVEPGVDNMWYADMSPTGSDEKLGPFPLRSIALREEADWLNTNFL